MAIERKRLDTMGADQLANTVRQVEATGEAVILGGRTYDESRQGSKEGDRVAIVPIKDFELLRKITGK